MPLPLILGIGAGIAAVGGIGSGVNGGMKMKHADSTMKRAIEKRNEALSSFELQNSVTTRQMDELGTLELEICASFQDFADVIERIQGRPGFKQFICDDIKISEYDPEELKKVSVGAGLLLGGVGGAAVGTAGGFAAAGVATAAIMAVGTASTGTAIASLSGVAATNATLAILGGGTLAAGGGGVALGTTILGVSTAGIGLLVGGIIFNIAGTGLSKKADEAYYQALGIERQVQVINAYLHDLKVYSQKYTQLLDQINTVYKDKYAILKDTVVNNGKVNWSEFNAEEKKNVQNCILLVGMLFKMCKVQLVKKSNAEKSEINNINREEIDESINQANHVLSDKNIRSDS